MASKFEVLRLREVPNPAYTGKVWAVQIAVDGTPAPVFFELERNRREMGEEAWMETLQGNAEMLLREYGPAPVMA